MASPSLGLLLKWYLTGRLRVRKAQDDFKDPVVLVAKRDKAHGIYLSHHRHEMFLKAEYARGVRDALDWATDNLEHLDGI